MPPVHQVAGRVPPRHGQRTVGRRRLTSTHATSSASTARNCMASAVGTRTSSQFQRRIEYLGRDENQLIRSSRRRGGHGDRCPGTRNRASSSWLRSISPQRHESQSEELRGHPRHQFRRVQRVPDRIEFMKTMPARSNKQFGRPPSHAGRRNSGFAPAPAGGRPAACPSDLRDRSGPSSGATSSCRHLPRPPGSPRGVRPATGPRSAPATGAVADSARGDPGAAVVVDRIVEPHSARPADWRGVGCRGGSNSHVSCAADDDERDVGRRHQPASATFAAHISPATWWFRAAGHRTSAT